MKCPHCQAENPEGVKFCGECGRSLAVELTCPQCGHKNPQGVKFCYECGHPLVEQTPLFGLDDTVFKGAFYSGTAMYWEKKGTEPVETVPAHSHDFDEVLVFAGQ